MSQWGRRIASRVLALTIFENLLIVAAVLASVWLRLGTAGWFSFTAENGYAKTWLIAVVVQTCFFFTDLYDRRAYADLRELFVRLVQGLSASSFCLAALYFWFPRLMIGRGIFLIAAVLVVAGVGLWRVADRWLGGRAGARERLLLVGTGAQAVGLATELYERRFELGVDIVGFIDPDPEQAAELVINPGIVGTIDDIPAIAAARDVSRVVVSVADARGKLPMDKLLQMKLAGVQFDHLASVYEEYTGKIAIENLRPSWFIFSAGFRKKRWLVAGKRAFDLLAAGGG
ncbi:MAG: hypothetical protein ABL982_23605, partial [Vicinamibacterales bacterium]